MSREYAFSILVKENNKGACWGSISKKQEYMAYLCIYCGHVNELKHILVDEHELFPEVALQ